MREWSLGRKQQRFPSVDTKRSFNIIQVTFNWKHLTKHLSDDASDEFNNKLSTFLFYFVKFAHMEEYVCYMALYSLVPLLVLI